MTRRRRNSDGDEHSSEAPKPLNPPDSFSRAIELLLYAASPLATLITAPLLARELGPSERGQFGVALAVGTFALTLAAWGQAEMYLSEARSGRFSVRRQSRITWVGGCVVGVFCIVALILLGIPPLTSILTGVWVPVLAQANVWRAVCVALGRLKQPALFTAGAPLLRVVALVALLLTSSLTLDSAVTATQVAAALAAFVTMWLIVRRIPRSLNPESSSVIPLLRGGGTIIAFSLLNAVTLRSDLVILQIFATSTEVGLYAAPASLTTAALALSGAYKSRLQAATFFTNSRASVAREALPVLALGLLGAGILWFGAPALVNFFFGPEYAGSVPLLRLLGFATVPLLMVDLAHGLLVALGRRHNLIAAGGAGAAAVVLSLLALTPGLGAVGAAIACILGYSVAGVVSWAFVYKNLKPHSREPKDS